jgi:hypothetical protein
MKLPTGYVPKRLVVNDRAARETASLGVRNVAPAAAKQGFANVQTYRLYCLDGVGKVESAQWLEAEDDAAALKTAEEMRKGRACELWQNHRLVARFRRAGTRDSGSGAAEAL